MNFALIRLKTIEDAERACFLLKEK